jgi:hypothetical protein
MDEPDAEVPLDDEPTEAFAARLAEPHAVAEETAPVRTRSAPVPVARSASGAVAVGHGGDTAVRFPAFAAPTAPAAPRTATAPAAPKAATAPAAPAAATAPAVNGATSGRPPLPVRRPQEHLAPQLREETTGPAQAATPAHSPETARNRLASYQKGWRAGRTGEIKPPSPEGPPSLPAE